jgi:hypothetical protein
MGRAVQGAIPFTANNFPLLQNVQTGSGIHTATQTTSPQVSFPSGKMAGTFVVRNKKHNTSVPLYAFMACTGTILPFN